AYIALTGADRVRWLNGMVTNNVRDLAANRGVYAFLLNPQGKIQADLYAFNRGERIVVETDSAQAETIRQIFDRYIIMDDVEIEPPLCEVIGLAGPTSADVLRRAGIPGAERLPELQVSEVQLDGGNLRLVRADNPWVASYEISGVDSVPQLWNSLLKAG